MNTNSYESLYDRFFRTTGATSTEEKAILLFGIWEELQRLNDYIKIEKQQSVSKKEECDV